MGYLIIVLYVAVPVYCIYYMFSAAGKIISAPRRAAKHVIKKIKDV